MWLAYLRFDGEEATKVALVLCRNPEETDRVLGVAKERFGPALAEYATFYSGRTIRPMVVPNFPENLIFSAETFLKACGVSAATPGPNRPLLT